MTMKILKLSLVAFTLTGAGILGCGNSSPNQADHYVFPSSGGTSGLDASGMGGTGGNTMDGSGSESAVPTDVPLPGTETGSNTPDSTSGEAGATVGGCDCTLLTPAQCQDCIINLTPDGVLIQEPGPNPSILYPECTAG